MTKLVNLNRLRKLKERKRKSSVAETNVVKFGQNKDEKSVCKMYIRAQTHHLDLHKREL